MRGDLPGLTEAALVLTPVDMEDSFDDGLLTASEIANLNLAARLVVLSACNTANFDLTLFSSQIQGLTTAFAVAGVPTTVASLWPVETETSQRIMARFYTHLNDSRTVTVAAALRASLMDVLRDAPSIAFRHPRFWAPFIVIGDGSSTVEPASGQADFDGVDDASHGGGEIMGAAAASDGGFVTSEIGRMDRGRSPSLIKKRSPEGTVTWEIEDSEIGAEKIIRSGAIYYAAGYVWRERSLPVLRAIGADGNVIWRREVSPQFKSSHIRALAELPGGDVAVMIIPSEPESGKDGAEIIAFDPTGSELRRFSIEMPARSNWGAVSGDLIVLPAGSLVASITSPKTNGPTLRDDFGLYTTCFEGGGSYLFSIDPAMKEIRRRNFVAGLRINSLVASGDRVFYAGSELEKCSLLGEVGVVGRIDQALNVARTWKETDAFDSRVVSLTPRGAGFMAPARLTRILSVQERKVDVNGLSGFAPPSLRKHYDFQRYTSQESVILYLDEDGRLSGRRFFNFGLPLFIQGIAGDGRSFLSYGSVGSNPWYGIVH